MLPNFSKCHVQALVWIPCTASFKLSIVLLKVYAEKHFPQFVVVNSFLKDLYEPFFIIYLCRSVEREEAIFEFPWVFFRFLFSQLETQLFIFKLVCCDQSCLNLMQQDFWVQCCHCFVIVGEIRDYSLLHILVHVGGDEPV